MRNLILTLIILFICGDIYAATEVSTSTTNVGIGTTSQTNQLSIKNGLAIGAASYTNTLAPTNGAIIQGNVGIGSLAPGVPLDVNGTIRLTAINGQTTGDILLNPTSNNVGIGTATPGAFKLDVSGTLRTTGFELTGNGVSSGNVMVTNSVGLGTWMSPSSIGVSGGGSSQFITYASVGIGTTDKVGLGTTSPTAGLTVMTGNIGLGSAWPGSLLDVVGQIRSTGTGTSNFLSNVGINSSAPGASLDVFGTFRSVSASGSSVFAVGVGNVGFGTLTPQSKIEIVGDDTTSTAYSILVRDSAFASLFTVNNKGNITSGTKGGVTFTAATTCGCKVFTNGLCTTLGTCT